MTIRVIERGMDEFIQEFDEIINLWTMLLPKYGGQFRIEAGGFITEQHINFLAGFGIIETKKRDGYLWILDISYSAIVLYNHHRKEIAEYITKSFISNKTYEDNVNLLELANKIFPTEKDNHCNKCCEYDEDGP